MGQQQIGPITKDVRDSAILLNIIAGHDEKDSTSVDMPKKDYEKALTGDLECIDEVTLLRALEGRVYL